MELTRFRATWDDALILSGGVMLGGLLGLMLPVWVVALAPVWVLGAWLAWQFLRAIRDTA